MDLMRRAAAGELSRTRRRGRVADGQAASAFRMRARARADARGGGAARKRATMTAYRDGVNAGLDGARLASVGILAAARRAAAVDATKTAILVIDAMFFDLHDSTNARELAFREDPQRAAGVGIQIPRAGGGPWDAPLLGPPMDYPALPPAGRPRPAKIDPKLLHVPPT